MVFFFFFLVESWKVKIQEAEAWQRRTEDLRVRAADRKLSHSTALPLLLNSSVILAHTFHRVIPSGTFYISEYLASDTLSLTWSSAKHSELQLTVIGDVFRYVQFKIKTTNKSQVFYFSNSAHKIGESC